MKKISYLFSVMLAITCLLTGCYDRDVLDSKVGDVSPMPEVKGISYTVSGSDLKITWNIPDNIPAEFERPISFRVAVYEDGTEKVQFVEDEGTSYTYDAYDAARKYKIGIKARAFLKEPAYGHTKEYFSLGLPIVVE